MGGGTRYAVSGIASAGTVVEAEPLPISHAALCCADPVTQLGLAATLASTPGCSATVTFDDVPAEVSSVIGVVYVG